MISVRTLVKSLKPPPPKMGPVHIRLLKRGARFSWIGLTDDMVFRTSELIALGDLERAGLVEVTKDPLPPGPPCFLPRQITEAGRQYLAQL